jgi:hypothetical protein
LVRGFLQVVGWEDAVRERCKGCVAGNLCSELRRKTERFAGTDGDTIAIFGKIPRWEAFTSDPITDSDSNDVLDAADSGIRCKSLQGIVR